MVEINSITIVLNKIYCETTVKSINRESTTVDCLCFIFFYYYLSRLLYNNLYNIMVTNKIPMGNKYAVNNYEYYNFV